MSDQAKTEKFNMRLSKRHADLLEKQSLEGGRSKAQHLCWLLEQYEKEPKS